MLFMRFLSLLLIVGIMLAPVAMPSADAQQPEPQQRVSHCGDMEGVTEQRSPDKQLRCMNACSAVEADCAQLPIRLASRPEPASSPEVASLGGIHPECETPPPRSS